MNSITKNIIISLVLGLVVYILNIFFNGTDFEIPTNGTQFASLASYILAIFIGCILASGGSSKTNTSHYEDEKESGTVKWFNVKKGYGFITRDQGDDVFLHYRNIQGEGRRVVSEGQRVQFIVIDGDKGLQADEVEAL